MQTKQLIPKHELEAMQKWLKNNQETTGGLMNIYSQYKQQTGFGRYDN